MSVAQLYYGVQSSEMPENSRTSQVKVTFDHILHCDMVNIYHTDYLVYSDACVMHSAVSQDAQYYISSTGYLFLE